MFEVGVVYRSATSRLWLAVSGNDIVSFRHGAWETRSPYKRDSYDVMRALTVAELCKRWGVDVGELDAALAAYLAPNPSARTRKREPHGEGGSARRAHADEREFWRALRMHRTTAG